MNTMRKMSEETNAGQDFYLLLGDFLDDYYRAGQDARAQMLAEPPEDMPGREHVAFLASAAHKLCNDGGMTPPEWVFENRCYLRDEPWFGCKAKGNLRLLFMYTSPIEFKHRNLFVDRNVLVRV